MCTEFEKMMHKKFQISSMGGLTFFLGLQVKQKEDGIFISQDKYVTEILKKFGFSDVKTATTPMETHKALPKDPDGEDVDEHLYRSMIGSLMYLTSSRPDIMFAVCTCARFHVNPKISHLHAVKMIFRYLKGQPKLGLWYPKDSPFELVAYTDSDYIGASLDWKSTTGGCQFLGFRLISWQCKKQNVVANSTIEAEYIATSNCCGQVLWIQNQLLDYGYNFMQTKIHIDNESTICIVKNPVFHSKTKHIEIRHQFIRDFNKKKFIQMIKIHTNQNVADLLTKWIIHKGWLEWNVKAAKDEIRVKTGNSRVNTVGHYLVLLAITLYCWAKLNATRQKVSAARLTYYCYITVRVTTTEEHDDFAQIVDFLNAHPIRKPKKVTEIHQSSEPTNLVAHEAVHEERGDRRKRAATTASSLEAEQDSGNIIRTQSMATINEPSPQGTSSGSGTRCQDTILGDADAQTRFETASKQSNDPPLLRVNPLRHGEDRLKFQELMEIYTKLSEQILALETTKTTQVKEIADLKKRGRSKIHGKHTSIFEDNDFDEDQFDANVDEAFEQVYELKNEKFSAPIHTAGVSISIAKPSTPPTTKNIPDEQDLTIAQTLMKIRSEKSKEKGKERGVIMKEPSETATRPTVSPQQLDPKDKGKGKMVEQKNPLKKKSQIKFDEEVALKLQAQMQDELEE
ncbi:putative ribonuclease H-like domain-containing protein [Tanacetum coccineum]